MALLQPSYSNFARIRVLHKLFSYNDGLEAGSCLLLLAEHNLLPLELLATEPLQRHSAL